MVNKCVIYGCKSGYKSDLRNDVTLHSFPKDKLLCDKWLRAIPPRKNFALSVYSRVCSLHFTDNDFVTERQDKKDRRRLQKDGTKLVKRYLKEDSTPSKFQNVPSYMKSKPSNRRPSATAASSSGRQQQEAERLDSLIEQFNLQDQITDVTVDELAAKLSAESAIPHGFQTIVVDGLLLIYLLHVNDFIPEIRASITIKPDLSFCCVVDKKKVPTSHLIDITTTGATLKTMSELVNVMARVKAWCDGAMPTKSPDLLLDFAVHCLEEYLSELDDENEERRKINFIAEQLKLGRQNKYVRHYSPQLIILSYLLHASSPAAYNTILDQNVMCFPSVKTLSKVTKQLNGNTGLDNMAYLKLRVSKLNEFERTVVLIIDEIYVAKRVEYTGGQVQGLTADGTVASTLLCFMVKSLVSRYKDVVAIYPVANLTASKQNECYNEVIKSLNSVGFCVVAISVDNATTNRKFFTDFLCGGTLRTSITNVETGQPIFLIFDPVHDLKNVYNNFQARKLFECPLWPEYLPSGCTADFNHVVQLYNHESSAALKKAHKLSPSVLQPKSIEKTSVKLATAVFCESTRDALQYYATHCSDKAEWAGTASFISVVLKLWNIMNVKTSAKGKHKRSTEMDPVRSSLDWKLTHLRQFADFLQRWEAKRKNGLTKETFLALRHTCLALADCAAYLLNRRAFNYVLLGHLQSDALECRFGWLRQLSGANYFISARQVMESDRKIRAVSLLKFSGVSLSEIEDAVNPDAVGRGDLEADTVADNIAASLKLDMAPTDSDSSIIYYVSGYIARSVVASTKCDYCRECVISTTDNKMTTQLSQIAASATTDVDAAEFLQQIDRGGLVHPTDFVYKLSIHCWRVFEEVWSNNELKSMFLKASGHRILFEKIMDRATYNDEFIDLLFGQNMCTAGHNLQVYVIRRFFNCVAKNFVKQITNAANPHHEPVAKKRKIAKLTSSAT